MKPTTLRSLTLTLGALSLFLPARLQAAYGDLYQVSPFGGAILKYTPTGGQTTFASSLQSTPNYIAFNGAGDLFVNEGSGGTAKITKITPAGVKTTFASGVEAHGLACDAAGNLFVSDGLSHSILKFTPAGAKSTFAAGLNTLDLIFAGGFGGPFLFAADFGADPGNPSGPGIDGQGKVYSFSADGTKHTFLQGLNRPKRLATDGAAIYVANSDGIILQYFLYAGIPTDDHTFASGLGNIQGLVCDAARNLFVSTSQAIVKFTPAKVKSTFVFATDPSGLAFEPPRDVALNISTRLGVQAGENALIAGFIVRGPQHKQVLVRGIGPTLTKFGVPGALQDPNIEMHFPTGVVISNDNWKDGNAATNLQGTAFAPGDDRESALAFDLPPGSYSVIETGVGNTTGIGLLEVYDRNPTSDSSLANISTRGFVGAGDSVMIGGFISGAGNGAGKVVIRAIGPSLGAFGISNPLQDPMVELRDKDGVLVVSNDNWGSGSGVQIQQLHLEPSNNLEAAVLATLLPGSYTAIISGKNGGTGVGLVEVYNIR